MGRRRSIFSFFSSQKPSSTSNSPIQPQDSQSNQDPIPPPTEQERYIPRQWEPNRLATLYVSPSERNLYLAAMAQLDQNPPSLPLWSEPSPSLPLVQHQPPIDSTPIKAIRMPLSPKLVTSPDLPIHGLSIREEFRLPVSMTAWKGGKEGQKHALLAFMGESGLRFHNFPVEVLVAVDEAIKASWSRGIKSNSESLGSLHKKGNGKEVNWEVTLKGKVWKQAGHSELESIRLMLSVLTTLGIHGWYLVEKMQATGSKNDHQNLLFVHSTLIQQHPPAFFAVSIPLPDRIALISPPSKATPGIISSIRDAIQTQTRQKGSVVLMDGRGSVTKGPNVERDKRKGGIKVEGWVHPGVYRFWLGGLRTWLGNSVKWRIVERLHPGLIISIINELSNQNFDLLTSLPLLPLLKGRDILIFASNPQSGLTARDTWISQPIPPTPPLSPSKGSPSSAYPSESPVIVDLEEAVPERGEVIPPELRTEYSAKDVARREGFNGIAEDRMKNMQTGKHGGRNEDSNSSPKGEHKQLGLAEILAQEEGRDRTISADSRQPLISSNTGSPRRRNLLIKNLSLNRKTSIPTSPPTRDETVYALRRRVSSLTDHGSKKGTERNNHRHASIDGRYNQATSSFDRRNTLGDEIGKVNKTGRHGVGSEVSTMDGEWDMVELPIPSRESLGLNIYPPGPTIDQFPTSDSNSLNADSRSNIPDTELNSRNPKKAPMKDDPKDKIDSTRPLSILNALAQTGFPPPAPPRLPPRPIHAPAPPSHKVPTPLPSLPSTFAPPAMQSRQSLDSVRTQYYDAETPGAFPLTQQRIPSTYNDNLGQSQHWNAHVNVEENLFGRPDSLYSEIDPRRELRIMDKTPPSNMILSPSNPIDLPGVSGAPKVPKVPVALGPVGPSGSGPGSVPVSVSVSVGMESPLLSPRSPMRGRNDLIEQNVGIGVESVAGSVGYLPSIASQSVLGLKEIPHTSRETRDIPLEEEMKAPGGEGVLSDANEERGLTRGRDVAQKFEEVGGEGKIKKGREKESKGKEKEKEKVGSSRTRILFGRK